MKDLKSTLKINLPGLKMSTTTIHMMQKIGFFKKGMFLLTVFFYEKVS